MGNIYTMDKTKYPYFLQEYYKTQCVNLEHNYNNNKVKIIQ